MFNPFTAGLLMKALDNTNYRVHSIEMSPTQSTFAQDRWGTEENYKQWVHNFSGDVNPAEVWNSSIQKLKDMGFVQGERDINKMTLPFIDTKYSDLEDYRRISIAIEWAVGNTIYTHEGVEVEDRGSTFVYRLAHETNNGLRFANGDKMLAWTKDRQDSLMGVFQDLEEFQADNGRAMNAIEMHDLWRKNKAEQGYIYGEVQDDEKKTHPSLRDFHELSRIERLKDVFMTQIFELREQIRFATMYKI